MDTNFKQTIKAIKTAFISTLCVSFKRKENNTTENRKRWYLWGNKKYESNNPELSKLMEKKMTFNQLKDKESELEKQRLVLIAKQSSIRFSKLLYNKNFLEEDYNKISDEIYQIDDLIKGIKAKISELGFEYEYVVERELPISDGGSEIWVVRRTIILGKEYPERLSNDEIIDFMISINIKTGESIKNIRRINKKK